MSIWLPYSHDNKHLFENKHGSKISMNQNWNTFKQAFLENKHALVIGCVILWLIIYNVSDKTHHLPIIHCAKLSSDLNTFDANIMKI